MTRKTNKFLVHNLVDTSNGHGDCPSPNRKRSVLHPYEEDSSTHSPKRHRIESVAYSGEIIQSTSNEVHPALTLASDPNPTSSSAYFNTKLSTHKRKGDSSNNQSKHESPKHNFPPFRLSLEDANGHSSTELSIIKDINKSTKLNLTYGRFAKSNNDKSSFLLYANTTNQFEFLLNKDNWPTTINNQTYTLDLPNKTPSSYSLVVLNVPPQWDAQAFGAELKQQYPAIIRSARLFRAGGRPLAKVRIDFSSYKSIAELCQSKRILLEDSNLAYPVEPYVQPTRILRCYNCQAYDNHISAHCPNKNDPVCFRCAQHHPYNPNCENQIKCAHCGGNHHAGNPNCSIKLDIRREINRRVKNNNASSSTKPSGTNHPPQAGNPGSSASITKPSNSAVIGPNPWINRRSAPNNNNITQPDFQPNDIKPMLDMINSHLIEIKHQQGLLNDKFDNLDSKIQNNRREILQIQSCLHNVLVPVMKEIVKTATTNINNADDRNLLQLLDNLANCSVFSSRQFHDEVSNASKITLVPVPLVPHTHTIVNHEP